MKKFLLAVGILIMIGSVGACETEVITLGQNVVLGLVGSAMAFIGVL